jgi:hypothetical protein
MADYLFYRYWPLVAVCLLGLGITGCSPSLSPLYRDYRVPADSSYSAADTSRIKKALREAGWTVRTSNQSRVIATDPQIVDNWILYKVEVSIETVPINDKYLRLYLHPRRRYITGGRTKISFLNDSLREQLVPPLTESFNKYGYKLTGRPEDRNRRIGG